MCLSLSLTVTVSLSLSRSYWSSLPPVAHQKVRETVGGKLCSPLPCLHLCCCPLLPRTPLCCVIHAHSEVLTSFMDLNKANKYKFHEPALWGWDLGWCACFYACCPCQSGLLFKHLVGCIIIGSKAFASKHEFLTFLIENILFAILIIYGPVFRWLNVIPLLQLCQQGHVCVSVLYHLCWMFVCAFACHLLQSSLISWETKKKIQINSVTCHTINLDLIVNLSRFLFFFSILQHLQKTWICSLP